MNQLTEEQRLWNGLKYRIQAASESRSRVRRQEHLDQALLYLNALNSDPTPPNVLTEEEADLVAGAIPLQSGLLDSQAAGNREAERVAMEGIKEGLRQRDERTATAMRDACVERVKEVATKTGVPRFGSLTIKANDAIAALESLTLDQVQEKRK